MQITLNERQAFTDSLKEEQDSLYTFDGLSLPAQWTFPNGEPKAVFLLLPGSGPVGLDGDISGPVLGSGYKGGNTKLHNQLAHLLALNGYASFRYAKRGHTDPAQIQNQTAAILTKDALSALSRIHSRFQGHRVALLGLSEGALISVLLASETPVDALFLLSLLTRRMSEALLYQFVEWPTQLLVKALGIWENHELFLKPKSPSKVQFPLLGPGFQSLPWTALDPHETGKVSVAEKLMPAYETNYKGIQELAQSPAFASWYHSFDQLPSFSSLAEKIHCPVHVYHGEKDAQFPGQTVSADLGSFRNGAKFRLFPGLGHCFSPMEGPLGEIKTAGPFDASLLGSLMEDIQISLN